MRTQWALDEWTHRCMALGADVVETSGAEVRTTTKTKGSEKDEDPSSRKGRWMDDGQVLSRQPSGGEELVDEGAREERGPDSTRDSHFGSTKMSPSVSSPPARNEREREVSESRRERPLGNFDGFFLSSPPGGPFPQRWRARWPRGSVPPNRRSSGDSEDLSVRGQAFAVTLRRTIPQGPGRRTSMGLAVVLLREALHDALSVPKDIVPEVRVVLRGDGPSEPPSCGVLCCVILCCSVLYFIVLCCIVLLWVGLGWIMLCGVVLCCVVLCCVVLCCAVLCCALLCCAVQCCVV